MKPVKQVDLRTIFISARKRDTIKTAIMVEDRCLHLLTERRQLAKKVDRLEHDLKKARAQLKVCEEKIGKAEQGDWSVLAEPPEQKGQKPPTEGAHHG